MAIVVAWNARAAPHDGWVISPSFALSQTYTDNVLLAPSATQGDTLTSIEPGLSMTRRSRRFNFASYYRMQNRQYWDHSELDDITHYLGANATLEAVRDRVFIDGFASLFPTHQNSFGRLSNLNSRNVGDNQVNVITYGLSPRFQYRLGSLADIRASIAYNKNDTGTNTQNQQVAGSSTSFDQNLRISGIPNNGRIDWYTSYQRQRENGDNGSTNDATFERSEVGLNFKINRFFTATSAVGYEDDSRTGSTNDRGVTWSLGGILTPSSRTKLAGRFGHRAFGDTKSFEFSYHVRRIILTGSYSEELRTTSQLLRQTRVFQTQDIFGNTITDPNLDGNIPIPLNQLGLRNDVFISRTLNADMGFQQRQGLLTLGVYRTEQEAQGNNSLNNDSVLGARVNWNHHFSFYLSGGVSVEYQTRDNQALLGSQKSLFVSPFMAYQLGPRLNSRLSYSYADESSDQALGSLFGGSFVENSITATLSYTY